MTRRPGSSRTVERIDDGAEADERVLDHLARLGCDPATPREVAHYLYVPDRPAALAVATVLDREGWLTAIEECGEPTYLVVAMRTRALTSAVVRETRRRLEALAGEHRGVYDGWEARTS
jgi:regulator of ribonuclease activity B